MSVLIVLHVAWCVQLKQFVISLVKSVSLSKRHHRDSIAVIYDELCSGCDFCVHICPWECLELLDPDTGEHAESFFGICELVKPKDCTGCKLCEEVCIKDAIRVESPILLELAEAAD